MKLPDAFATGFAHLSQNRLRAGLSILGILIGIASVLCMMAIGDGAKKIIADDIDTLGGANQFQFVTRTAIYRNGRFVRRTRERLNVGDARAIEAECPDVLFVLPKNERYRVLFTSSQGGEARAILEGVTADYDWGMRWNAQEGRFLSEGDVDAATQVCVLGAQVALNLFGAESPLGQEVKIRYAWNRPVRCRVVGVMAPRGRNLRTAWSLDDVVCIPLSTYRQRVSGRDYVERLTVFFKAGADIDAVIASARAVIRKRHHNRDEFAYSWTARWTIKRLTHIEKVIKIALGSIAGFSLFVSGIGIMNICLVSVGEKTREIGLRKSVGAKRSDIFWQFLTESVCLCLCGGISGIGCGWLAAHGMAQLAVRIVPIVPKWPVVLSGLWILSSVIFSIFMGISFGVYPAMRAARLTPIEALRTEK